MNVAVVAWAFTRPPVANSHFSDVMHGLRLKFIEGFP